MSLLQNVILVGATGNLGSAVLSALRQHTLNLRVLARKDSKSIKELEAYGIKVLPVDYESYSSLTEALKGADVVVSTIASNAIPTQRKIIDAAIAANVQRFIPSEFGADTYDEKAGKLPVYSRKVAIQKYLEQKASEGKIEWTAILGGPFLDWGLERGMLGFHSKEKKVVLYDDGVRPLSTTLLSDLGKAVIGVLEHPGETRNRAIYVQSTRVSQLDILAIYESLTEPNWQRIDLSTAELEKRGLEKLTKKDMSGMSDLILRALFGEGYGCDFMGKDANALVGVKELNKEELTELVKSLL